MSRPLSDEAIRDLRRNRPRSRYLRVSGLVAVALVLAAWIAGEFDLGPLFESHRRDNVLRFLDEARPRTLQDGGDGSVWTWARELWHRRGRTALGRTFAVSVIAITLAGLAASILSLPAARTWAAPEPYVSTSRTMSYRTRMLWKLVVPTTRGLLIALRSIPEYLLAFLLFASLGPSLWPLILALAIHNAGIVAKLTSEAVDNTNPAPFIGLRLLGASRGQIAFTAVFPLVLPRFLLFLFYRWETCVREATVLGMLGVSSLGYWIVDARTRNHYDEMLYFVVLGAALVLVGDVLSAIIRRAVRLA